MHKAQFAVVSDIHGNLPALEAVVADIQRRAIAHVLNLGDHVSGPLWPRETIAYLMAQPWPHIAGNCDREVFSQPAAALGLSDRYAHDRLSAAQIAWLRQLPKTASIEPGLLMTHGTPSDDNSYLLEQVIAGGAALASARVIAERLGTVSEAVVLCGHSHIPRVVSTTDGTLLVNPGSVGLPAYETDNPTAHVMESGSPHARYAVLTLTGLDWSVDLIAVPYDHASAARKAAEANRPDWAIALQTGHMA